ncbi:MULTISPECIES: hypothetical protein, partial [unclassified Pseudomonas]|uniref:hypothetical protein n=1 Tax=unclassified Pseudomonas TaxID=196821 RepID=UPI002B23D216
WGLAEQYLKPVKAGLPTKAMCQAPLSQAIRRQACSNRFGAWLSNIQLVGVGLPTKAIPKAQTSSVNHQRMDPALDDVAWQAALNS